MMSLQVYFDLDKKFSLNVSNLIVQSFIKKYGSKVISAEGSVAARELYGDGNGGNISLVNLPYNHLIIEAQSRTRYERIPEGKVYVYMSTDMSNVRNMKLLKEFVDDAIMVYNALKPKLGLGGIESSFEFDGTHFLRGLYVCPLMLLGPQMVKNIGTDRVMVLKGQIFEVRMLNDGGVMLRLMKIKANEPLNSGLEDAVRRELGIK